MLKYSKDNRVAFDPTYHTYTLDGTKRLKGVTGLISKYKNPFDADGISKAMAKKSGLPPQFYLDLWAAKGKASRELGTKCHSIFEDFITHDKLELTYQHPKELQAKLFINDYFLSGKLKPVGCEEIIYNDNVASMIDTPVMSTKNEYFILDYKTNEEIKTTGYKGAMMLPPFQNYCDADFFHYSIQTSIYRRLYHEHPIKDCFIVHLLENEYKLLKCIDIKECELII